MAGWKLRKDKASAETPGTDSDPASAEEASPEASAEAPFLDTIPGLPDFDSDPDTHFESGSHFDGLEFSPAVSDPDHAGNGPLTLVNYTDGGEADSQESHAAHIYDAPSYADSAAIAMPPQEPASTNFASSTESRANPEADTEFETLPASSSWLSSDFTADTPSVAPFVLDTPPPVAPAVTPQIVVHIGRLSAPFALTKDVTTVGRPDSALSHYPDVEIEMDDAVSRRHCEIVRRDGGYFLVDTGSTNGTRLNGETLLPHQEHLLAHGDRIHIGDRTEITFE